MTRYKAKEDVDEPILAQVLPEYDATWDKFKNDPLKMRRIVKIFGL